MGKLLETLKPLDRPVVTLAGTTTTAAESPAEPVEEIPFIEVGGRRGPVEGSPAVLASMAVPPAKVAVGPRDARFPAQPLSDGARSGPKFQATPSATLAETSGLTVAFRPVAADSRPLQPPQTRFAPELVAFHRPETVAGRQYQALAATLTAQLPAAHSAVLSFVAATRGVGATTVLLNLAITFARHDPSGARRRVAVVDADLWQPRVAQRLGLYPGPGLREVLLGTVMLHQALQETGEPNLAALTAGDGPPGQVPGRLAVGVAGVVRQLREQFDLILLDAPAVEERLEVGELAAASNAVYVVVPQSAAETPQTAALLRSLASRGSPVRGQILTER
jgi:Mrp family chromosome partitioning ATPase